MVLNSNSNELSVQPLTQRTEPIQENVGSVWGGGDTFSVTFTKGFFVPNSQKLNSKLYFVI